jgi:hypothetical protein
VNLRLILAGKVDACSIEEIIPNRIGWKNQTSLSLLDDAYLSHAVGKGYDLRKANGLGAIRSD